VTAAPRWLDDQWKGGGVPETFLTGTLEERAKRILDERRTIKSSLLKALVVDLVAAAAHQRKFPKAIETLLVQVLGLRKGHKAGDWSRRDLERRGRRNVDIEAWSTMVMLDRFCFKNYGKVMSQHAMARRLKRMGFRTDQRRIGEWRQDYAPSITPELTMSPEEERRVPPFPIGGPGIKFGLLPPEE